MRNDIDWVAEYADSPTDEEVAERTGYSVRTCRAKRLALTDKKKPCVNGRGAHGVGTHTQTYAQLDRELRARRMSK